LNFSLFGASCTVLHSETDTGFATGSITYTPSGPDNTFVTSNASARPSSQHPPCGRLWRLRVAPRPMT